MCGASIKASSNAKNLGVCIDQELTMKDHIGYICKSCYNYLRNIHLIRPYLTVATAKTIVHAVISAKIEYCNSLFIGIAEYLVTKLQSVQNCAARSVLNLRKYDSITPALIKQQYDSI